jgi:hypothetical protein
MNCLLLCLGDGRQLPHQSPNQKEMMRGILGVYGSNALDGVYLPTNKDEPPQANPKVLWDVIRYYRCFHDLDP